MHSMAVFTLKKRLTCLLYVRERFLYFLMLNMLICKYLRYLSSVKVLHREWYLHFWGRFWPWFPAWIQECSVPATWQEYPRR